MQLDGLRLSLKTEPDNESLSRHPFPHFSSIPARKGRDKSLDEEQVSPIPPPFPSPPPKHQHRPIQDSRPPTSGRPCFSQALEKKKKKKDTSLRLRCAIQTRTLCSERRRRGPRLGLAFRREIRRGFCPPPRFGGARCLAE